MTPLHTIGYEKAGVGPFLTRLNAAGIKHVIDVRDLPLSRRAGFSKTALGNALHRDGIAYTHLRALGTPPAGREANRRRQWPLFWQIVENRLQTPEAHHALDHAITLARQTPACLLCYEADHAVCHRLRVAQRMCEAYPFALTHLTV